MFHKISCDVIQKVTLAESETEDHKISCSLFPHAQAVNSQYPNNRCYRDLGVGGSTYSLKLEL